MKYLLTILFLTAAITCFAGQNPVLQTIYTTGTLAQADAHIGTNAIPFATPAQTAAGTSTTLAVNPYGLAQSGVLNGGSTTNALHVGSSGSVYDANLITNVQGSTVVGSVGSAATAGTAFQVFTPILFSNNTVILGQGWTNDTGFNTLFYVKGTSGGHPYYTNFDATIAINSVGSGSSARYYLSNSVSGNQFHASAITTNPTAVAVWLTNRGTGPAGYIIYAPQNNWVTNTVMPTNLVMPPNLVLNGGSGTFGDFATTISAGTVVISNAVGLPLYIKGTGGRYVYFDSAGGMFGNGYWDLAGVAHNGNIGGMLNLAQDTPLGYAAEIGSPDYTPLTFWGPCTIGAGGGNGFTNVWWIEGQPMLTIGPAAPNRNYGTFGFSQASGGLFTLSDYGFMHEYSPNARMFMMRSYPNGQADLATSTNSAGTFVMDNSNGVFCLGAIDLRGVFLGGPALVIQSNGTATFTGNGSGLTNITSTSIAGGITTNLQFTDTLVGTTNSLYFTNGILMRVTAP